MASTTLPILFQDCKDVSARSLLDQKRIYRAQKNPAKVRAFNRVAEDVAKAQYLSIQPSQER